MPLPDYLPASRLLAEALTAYEEASEALNQSISHLADAYAAMPNGLDGNGSGRGDHQPGSPRDVADTIVGSLEDAQRSLDSAKPISTLKSLIQRCGGSPQETSDGKTEVPSSSHP